MYPTFLTNRLKDRLEAGLTRRLSVAGSRVDFCSNDYLGMARSPVLKAAIRQAEDAHPTSLSGATGSRLLAGHTLLADQVETELAHFYQTEAALIFNSGYDANLGLLASLPQRGDTLITDELIHASMIDGARLSYATRYRFRHNDLHDLEIQLQHPRTGQVFVAVESVYSMDGDIAPLPAIADLCDRYNAFLLVDEAHATGVFGPNGEGMVIALGLQKRVLARVHTFGKALGVHGAAVVGPAALKDYLVNFARSFIYTTALPPHSLLAIQAAHQYVQQYSEAQETLHQRIAFFNQQVQENLPNTVWTTSQTPIQCLVIPGNQACRQVAAIAQEAGFDVRAILSPTVPAGQERLRICLHAFNTNPDIIRFVNTLAVAIHTH